jgi:hypothetical protein
VKESDRTVHIVLHLLHLFLREEERNVINPNQHSLTDCKVSYLGYIAKGIGPTSQATADIDQELVANLHLKISKLSKQN